MAVEALEDAQGAGRAETAGEILERVETRVLIAQEDDLVFEEGAVDLGESLVIHRVGGVDTGNLGAERARDRSNLDMLVGHGSDPSSRAHTGRSPWSVMRCMRRRCPRKSATAVCRVQRLSQKATAFSDQRKRQVNSGRMA